MSGFQHRVQSAIEGKRFPTTDGFGTFKPVQEGSVTEKERFARVINVLDMEGWKKKWFVGFLFGTKMRRFIYWQVAAQGVTHREELDWGRSRRCYRWCTYFDSWRTWRSPWFSRKSWHLEFSSRKVTNWAFNWEQENSYQMQRRMFKHQEMVLLLELKRLGTAQYSLPLVFEHVVMPKDGSDRIMCKRKNFIWYSDRSLSCFMRT